MVMTRSGLTTAVEAFVAPSLEPGETIEATLSNAYSGSSYWLAHIRTMIPLGGRTIGYALVGTDRRVRRVRRATFASVKPTAVDATFSRSDVRVRAFTMGPFTGSLSLDVGRTEPMGITFPRTWRDDAKRVADTLRHREVRRWSSSSSISWSERRG